MALATASRSLILEAPDDACGYLNGMEKATFGCHQTSERCAIYYPASSATATTATHATMMPMITPAPQPSIVCCEPSRGDCTVQPTACADALGGCTGICSNDPMTLKCTAGVDNYCNRAHFESPLSFRRVDALGAGLRPTDAPLDGWFCGPSVLPIQQTEASHSSIAPVAHMGHSQASPTTTLSITVTLSKPGLGLGPPVRPSTTLSVTITLSKPGLGPGPTPPAALPVASPEGTINGGSAVVSTAYTGQNDRAPFVEATRPWSVVTPTAIATSATKTAGPRTKPFTPKGKKKRLGDIGIIVSTTIVGGSGILAVAYCAWRK